MPVLVEAISVIVRAAAIERGLRGGWSAFESIVPNATFCSDGELARVGFMHPDDVQHFVERLEAEGLAYVRDGIAVDLVVVDQQRGPMVPCEWIEFHESTLPGDGGGRVSLARLRGSMSNQMAAPAGWEYEGSLSQTFTFVPSEPISPSVERKDRRDGIERFKSLLTGKTLFMGRTSGRDDKE